MSALHSESITKVTTALIAAQSQFKPAVRDAENPHFGSRFVSLTGVLDAVKDALHANQIAVVQPTDRDGDGTTLLLTRLIHESGEWLGSVYPVRPVKNDPQAEGSALTYARRFALMSLVGIAPEDDDGNAASAPKGETQPPVDPCVALRNVIAELGAVRGWSLTDTGADFYTWSTGVDIRQAAEPLLAKYADYLRTTVRA